MQLGGIDIVVLLIRRILRHLDGPRLYASFCRLWKGGEVQIERGVRSVSERRGGASQFLTSGTGITFL